MSKHLLHHLPWVPNPTKPIFVYYTCGTKPSDVTASDGRWTEVSRAPSCDNWWPLPLSLSQSGGQAPSGHVRPPGVPSGPFTGHSSAMHCPALSQSQRIQLSFPVIHPGVACQNSYRKGRSFGCSCQADVRHNTGNQPTLTAGT